MANRKCMQNDIQTYYEISFCSIDLEHYGYGISFWGMFSENTRNETFVSVSIMKFVLGDANFSLSVVCIYFLHVDIHMNVKCEYV